MIYNKEDYIIYTLYFISLGFLILSSLMAPNFWQTASAIAVVLTLIIIALNAHADHKRRRKQLTIKRLGPLVRKLRRRMQLKDPDPRDVLEELEHELAGVNDDVYDLDLFVKMFGYTVPILYDELEEHVKDLREDDEMAYKEFERVAEKFENKLDKYETSKSSQRKNWRKEGRKLRYKRMPLINEP